MKKESKSNEISFFIVLIALGVALAVIFLVQHPGTVGIQSNTPLDKTFPVGSIAIGSVKYYVYLAKTLPQQEQGYMNQTTIGDCNGNSPCLGMLFVFNNVSTECFWMKNTIMPLKQVWIANGTVDYVYSATPKSLATVCANGNLVLETATNFTIPAGTRVLFNTS